MKKGVFMFDGADTAVFYVRDFVKDNSSDDAAIKDCFDFARPFPSKTIIFDTKNWYIQHAIEVGSNTSIVIDGSTIKQKDDTFDNIFRAGMFTINKEDPNGFPASIEPSEYIDSVYDSNPVSESNRLAIVGSYKGYSSGYNPGDIHSVRLSNIVSNSAKYAIVINDTVANLWINKVTQNRKDGELLHAVDMEGVKFWRVALRTVFMSQAVIAPCAIATRCAPRTGNIHECIDA